MTFLANLPPHGPGRDHVLLAAIAAGQIDPPVWVRVPMGRVEIWVSADYLAIAGERVPMSAPVAQAAVDALDALLPTPAIVDAIEDAATIVPLPTWAPPAGQSRAAQTSSAVLALCETRTRALFDLRRIPAGQLVAGHRKDVVIAKHMPPGDVVIYGARWPSGHRLQPLYPAPGVDGHEASYEDYSHGVRAVRDACLLDGEPTSVSAILEGPEASLLGGPVARLRYASPAKSTATSSPRTSSATTSTTLRVGAHGPAVEELQRELTAAGIYVRADGIFGPLTETAVRRFQELHGLDVDGIVGPETFAALHEPPPPTEPAGAVYPDAVARTLGLRPPLAESEVDRAFGAISWTPVAGDDSAIAVPASWQREHLTLVTIPQLLGIQGAPVGGRVQIARSIADQTCALWATWERKGKLPLVRSWAGSLAFRRVRGGVLVSRHARGLAFDINVAWNPRGTPGAPRGATGSVCDLLEDLPDHGFTTGGLYGLPDWMHFEATEVRS